MTTETVSFIPVLNKYMVYSEALSQYHRLPEEDQKIIEPYIQHLKQSWKEELKEVTFKVTAQAEKKFFK